MRKLRCPLKEYNTSIYCKQLIDVFGKYSQHILDACSFNRDKPCLLYSSLSVPEIINLKQPLCILFKCVGLLIFFFFNHKWFIECLFDGILTFHMA